MSSSKRKVGDFLLLIPGIGFIVVFTVILILYMLAQSVGLFTINGQSSFSMDAWGKFLDKKFLDALLYSLKVGIISSLLSLAICYPLSMMLQVSPGKTFIVSFIKVPMFIPMLVGCFLMLNLIDYNGLVNFLLVNLEIVQEPVRMRNDPYAIGVIILQVWKNVPMQILIMYSALQGIRSDIKEAARNLGCKGFRLFREIIFPLTIVNALVAVILTFIGVFFDFAASATAGPVYPVSLSYLMHNTAYQMQEWGQAACMGVVMTLVAVLVIYAYSKLAQTVQKF